MGYEISRDREVRLNQGHCNSVKLTFLAFDERVREIVVRMIHLNIMLSTCMTLRFVTSPLQIFVYMLVGC